MEPREFGLLQKLVNDDALWDLVWLAADCSKCLKKRVGAILVNNFPVTRILGTGFGGAKEVCKECLRKELEWTQDGCWSVHAEIRAMMDYFDRYGWNKDLSHTVMVTTHGPCDQCIKYMNLFSIPYVIYDKEYKTDYSKWKTIKIYSIKEIKENADLL